MKSGAVQLHVVVHFLRLHLWRLIALPVALNHGLGLEQTIAGEDHGSGIRHPGEVLEAPSKGAEIEEGLVHIDEG